MRAKFGSILGAHVTDEICEYHSERGVSSAPPVQKVPNHSYSTHIIRQAEARPAASSFVAVAAHAERRPWDGCVCVEAHMRIRFRPAGAMLRYNKRTVG